MLVLRSLISGASASGVTWSDKGAVKVDSGADGVAGFGEDASRERLFTARVASRIAWIAGGSARLSSPCGMKRSAS